MDIHSLSNIHLDGEHPDCLWLHFNVSREIQERCEIELQPHELDWSNRFGDGHIAVPYETTDVCSDESPIIGGLYDLPDLSDEFSDFLVELTELAHEAMDSQSLQLKWMLGVPAKDLTHHDLKLTISYYANRSLCLSTNKNSGEAYFYFEDRSDNLPYYTGNYKKFETLDIALLHFNTVYEEVEWDDFSVVSRFFELIESTKRNGEL